MNVQSPQDDSESDLDPAWSRYYADQRANELASLRRIMNNDLHPVEVRLHAIKRLNRMQGLVPVDAPWD